MYFAAASSTSPVDAENAGPDTDPVGPSASALSPEPELQPEPESDSVRGDIEDDPFALVPDPLRRAMQTRGFAQLTEVQTAVLAADDGARDLQISSQTGSGKTVALGFVLAARLLAAGPKRGLPSTLVIVPTRELAMQVNEELTWLFAHEASATFACVTGGTSVVAERARLARKPSVVVGTPGRLLDHIRSGALAAGAMQQLVLDEADQMLDLGFREDLEAILEGMPAERRTHLVSATFPPAVRSLAQRFQRDALPVAGTELGSAHADIAHVAHLLQPRDRYAALVNLLLLAGDERTLVFVRTRMDTTTLADKLTADGFAAVPISGDLAQAQRTRTLESFRRGTVTTLIATDVAARGLDVRDVTMVVHADPPIDSDTYTHRSGRTGRAGQKGKSVMLVPRLRERAVRRLLDGARVEAEWLPVPTGEVVRGKQHERQAERVTSALATARPSERQRQLAATLLTASTPKDVVAGLLSMLASKDAREPFAFDGPSPMPFDRARGKRVEKGFPRAAREFTAAAGAKYAPADAVELGDDGRPVPAATKRSGIGAGRRRPYTKFEINWGANSGADVKRILAHVCRRGAIGSDQIGVIDLRAHSSHFEVADEAAPDFARRVSRRDARDPHLVIVPARGTSGDDDFAAGPARPPRATRPPKFAPRKPGFARRR